MYKKIIKIILPLVFFLSILTIGGCGNGPVLLSPENSDGNTEPNVQSPPVDQGEGHVENVVSAYLKAFKAPGCDPANPEVLFISDATGWQQINSLDYRIFCVKPGRYNDLGTIRLSASGSETSPRVILLDSTQSTEHPAALAEREQAILESLSFDNASHWIVSRLSILDTPSDSTAVVFNSGSSFNTLDQMRIERFYYGLDIHNRANANTIQLSLVGNINVRRGSDTVCIGLLGYRSQPESIEIVNTRIINNEIYNCNDGIQTIINPDIRYSVDFSGLIIDANDIYLTPAMYTDCAGGRNPTGNCACAENAIDLKAGTDNTNSPVRITNNRLWGMRKTDVQCGGSGSWGAALVGSFNTRNALIADNVIFDSARGISFSTGPSDLTVSGNLIHGINSTRDNEGLALSTTADTRRLSFLRNTIVDAGSWLVLQASDSQVECNVLIDSGAARGVVRSGTVVDRNSYFNTPEWSSSSNENVVYGLASDSASEELCFTVKRISNPENVCLAYGQSTDASPYHSCSGPDQT
ncbi:MAG: hypothetical protein KDJ38_12800 [Gammaproteobacteria bacterium]|nr:hypothetical protein [Gammaproteobacteria bacterium]